MRLNNPQRVLGNRAHNEGAPHPPRGPRTGLNLADSSVQAFYGGLRSEWIRSEGRKAELVLGPALGNFSPVAWSRPENLTSVRRELAQTGTTGQLLDYAPAPIHATSVALAATHRTISSLEHPARDAVFSKIRATEAGCEAFAALRQEHSNDPVTRWSLDYYGRPSADVLQTAQAILNGGGPENDAGKSFSTEEIVAVFNHQLDGVFGSWTATTGDIQAAVLVDQARQRLVIREELVASQAEVHRLLVHEVGCHLLRSTNAGQSPGSLASVRLGHDSAATEEGLAVWWEHELGVQQHRVMRRYAARAIAVDIGLRAGASAIMNELAPVIGAEEAAAMTLRVKRGMHNPEDPGAFTKDHVYLTGYLAVHAAVRSAPASLPILMATKWGLSMTPVADALVSEDVLLPGKMPWEVSDEFARRA